MAGVLIGLLLELLGAELPEVLPAGELESLLLVAAEGDVDEVGLAEVSGLLLWLAEPLGDFLLEVFGTELPELVAAEEVQGLSLVAVDGDTERLAEDEVKGLVLCPVETIEDLLLAMFEGELDGFMLEPEVDIALDGAFPELVAGVLEPDEKLDAGLVEGEFEGLPVAIVL